MEPVWPAVAVATEIEDGCMMREGIHAFVDAFTGTQGH